VKLLLPRAARVCRIANIGSNLAMILPPETNPGRTEFSERTGAGVTDRLWEIGDVVNVLEDWQNNTR